MPSDLIRESWNDRIIVNQRVMRHFQVKRLVTIFILLGIFGCGHAVPHKIAKDYKNKIPGTIAVLPVIGEKADSDARYLFRIMTQEKLHQLNYNLLPIDVVDEKITSANIGKKEFLSKPPADMARLLNVDAVVYVTITDYDRDFLITYAALSIEARFDMYLGTAGDKIWTAKYKHKESDFGIDKNMLKIQMAKIYEPIIQRIIDASFSTLPVNPEKRETNKQGEEKKRYFEWLK